MPRKRSGTTQPAPDLASRFADEYLLDLNATQAYLRCKPKVTAKTAATEGYKLLRKPEIQQRIAALQELRSRRTQITQDRALEEVAALAFSDIGEVVDFAGDRLALKAPSTIPDRARRAIAGVKVRRYVEGQGEDAREVEVVEFKMHDKPGQVRLAGQHLGLFKTEVDLTSKGKQVGAASDEDLATFFARAARDPFVRAWAQREYPDVVRELAAGGAVTP